MSKQGAASRLAAQSLSLLEYVLTRPDQAQTLNALSAHLIHLPDVNQLMAYLEGQVHLQTMHNDIEESLQGWDPAQAP